MLEVPEVCRRQFSEALNRDIYQASSNACSMALLLIDISNLAQINHTHGYEVGDLVLATAQARLNSVSKLPDNVYRIGSHRFAFILPSLVNPAFLSLAVNRINTLLSAEIAVQQVSVTSEVHVGIAINPEGQLDASSTLSKAENSLREVKAGGDLEFFESSEGPDHKWNRIKLEQQFINTLSSNAFELFYQPKVNLRTGKADRCEALLRWQLDGSYISPERTLELAESQNQGYGLGKWVLSQALRQARSWESSFDMNVAINMQANMVNSPDLHSLVADTLGIWGVSKQLITLEITESAIIDDKESGFNNLLKLTELGIGLSIDDFGTGYSSLSYFKHIPAKELKIDRSFVMTMTTDPQNLALVKIIIDIAHLFDMTVVAEGIEDRETLEALIANGCDYGQGYYLSRPLAVKEFEAWIQAWPGLNL